MDLDLNPADFENYDRYWLDLDQGYLELQRYPGVLDIPHLDLISSA